MADEIKIINADDAEAIDPGLENAGWKRDEQLAERKDNLEQAAEQASEEREVFTFDPATFDPENEIMRLLDELEVDGAQPGRRYFWCYEGQKGRFIRASQRLGWTVVQAADPECPTIKDARGYRVIGDAVLMWATEAQYAKIIAMQEYRQLLHEKGVGSALKELGEKYRDKGFVVHDDAASVPVGSKNANLMDMMETKAHQTGTRSVAQKGVDQMLRNGTVPGMGVGGGRGR